MLQAMQFGTERSLSCHDPARSRFRFAARRICAPLLPVLVLLAGCGNANVTANPTKSVFSIGLGATTIDTNCTGCNVTTAQGGSAEQFTATLAAGGKAPVTWTVSGGDAQSGAGSINATGQYTPPSYLTADSVQAVVKASLASDPSIAATSLLTVTPGFLQPLTPENVALGANGSVNITGLFAEAGGNTSINFDLASSANGTSGGLGTLSSPSCRRSSQAFTSCTVTYFAPATIAATGTTYVVATVGSSSTRTSTEILLNTAGVSSNPATHQAELATPMQLGSSGGNNNDYDSVKNQIVDCCSGTLGSLLKGSDNKLYLLSNNHVLARSDQASVGDAIIQPGLIDNNCTPSGEGAGTMPVGSLTAWLPLNTSATNVDAAIAQVASGAVDITGSILEMGAKQPDGTLAAAPPGISSTGGKGEAASLQMKVAKSGRTTGQTCASVSAIKLDVNVDYYLDCAETAPYLSKTFTNQLAISGNGFSDAGDSGSLVVDSGNAEPVGLYFAGGRDASGVSHAIANPVADVLSELGTQGGGGITYSFVGTADHAVGCLNYGDSTVTAAQARVLSDAETTRALQSMAQARALVNLAAGVLGVAPGKSSDHPGEAAILLYVDENTAVNAPASVGGARTVVIPSNGQAVATGTAPLNNSLAAATTLPAAVLNSAVAIKPQYAATLMKQNPAFFGVGVGQSLDNPKEAALVIYVDRKQEPVQLPQSVGGLRTRYIVMDRLHVTRAYTTPVQSRLHCMPHSATDQPTRFDPLTLRKPLELRFN